MKYESYAFLDKWSQMHIDGPSQIPNKLFITCHFIFIYNVGDFSIDRYLHVSNTYNNSCSIFMFYKKSCYSLWVLYILTKYVVDQSSLFKWLLLQNCVKINETTFVFELIYYTNGHSRAWLTSINIDPKCHTYQLY